MRAKDSTLIIVGGSTATLLVLILVLVGLYSPGAQVRRLETQVPYPILLIHGLGGEGKGWVDAGMTDYFEQAGLRFGGEVYTNLEGEMRLERGSFPPSVSDFFVVSISDPFQSLELWQQEIHTAVEQILGWTGAPKLVLVGFSAGGVAARKYLVEHLDDHRVAKLVTVASPHRGSELALVYRVDKGIREALEGGSLTKRLAAEYEAIVERVEAATKIQIDAPLLGELIPPEYDGEFLKQLNQSPHPKDVEYVSLITTGSPLVFGNREVENEVAVLRSFLIKKSKLVEKFLTGVMGFLSRDSNASSYEGDIAVLVGSQHLGRVKFFCEYPELLSKVDTIQASHFSGKSSYREVLGAIGGRAKGLRSALSADSRLMLEYADYIPSLTQMEVRESQGRPLALSDLEIWRREDEGFVRRNVGPLSEPLPNCLELFMKIPGEATTFGQRLMLAERTNHGEFECPGPSVSRTGEVRFHLRKIWGFSNRRVDLLDAAPELMAVLFVDEIEVARSATAEHPRDPFEPDWQVDFTYDPRSSRIRLEIRDIDSGNVSEILSTRTWNPGRLKLGRSVVTVGTGIRVEFDLISRDGDGVVWDEETVYLRELDST